MVQPNIPQDGLRLLWLDRYDVIPFAWAQDNVPIDVSGRVFKLVFYEEDGVTERLTIEDAMLKKVPGRNDKRTWRPSNAARAQLDRLKTYKVVLFELIVEDGETLSFYYAHFEFKWWTLPEQFQTGMPRKPPTALINHVTLTGTVVVLAVYEIPQGPVPYASVAAALAAPLPQGQADQVGYVTIDSVKQYFFKDAQGLTPINTGQRITQP